MDLKIGRSTLLDPNALEYQWIRFLDHKGSSIEMINQSIQRCLGGSEIIVDKMRQVALGHCPVTDLLRELPVTY